MTAVPSTPPPGPPTPPDERAAAGPDLRARPAVDAAVDAALVEQWTEQLRAGAGPGVTPGTVPGGARDVVAMIAALEDLKAAACAAQAQHAVALDTAERDRQAHAGMPPARRGLGVAAQLALARRESPHRAARLLGAAKILLTEMPCTYDALRHGRLSEHRAVLLVAETACLDLEDRRTIDQLVCADPSTLEGLGTRRLVTLVRGHAARLDPASLVRRARKATNQRCVTIRPAPDTMTYVTALLPVADGVALYAALRAAADHARSTPGGDPRGQGQLMADTLVERVTGRTTAEPTPITINLTMSDTTLLGSGHEPALIDNHSPVPAQIARAMIAQGLDAEAVWLRRLYANPHGRLVAMSSRQRFHPDALAAFLRVRDQGICRTPYCDAPIRHLDHITPHAHGGTTDTTNTQGLCQACNHAKQAPGWTQTVDHETD